MMPTVAGDRAAPADDLLQAQRELEVVRIGQSVGDHGGFRHETAGSARSVGDVDEIEKGSDIVFMGVHCITTVGELTVDDAV